jgi:DNA-binding protein H-NS
MARGKENSKHIEALNDLSVSELVEVISAAQSLRTKKIEEARLNLVEEMRGKAKELGLSLDDLMQRKGRASSAPTTGRSSVAPKYEFESGLKWSGRGKMPKEAAEAKRKHGSLDKFLISAH